MHNPLITRAKATSLAAVLVALAMCLGVGGFTATTASAAATIAPSAPTDLFASSDGGTGVYVSWDPTTAGDGTDDADRYTVTLDDGVPADRRTGWSLAEDGTTALVLSVPANTYNVTVTAVNAHGSATSAPLSFVMMNNTTEPSAPLNVVAHNAADGVVRITWDSPTSEGSSPIEEYQVSLQFPNSIDPASGAPYGLWNGQILDGSDREYTFRQLAFDHGDFIVTVTAVNGSRYPGYLAKTDPAPLVRSTVSSAPTQLSAASSAANQVAVTWGAPSSDGGFAVTDYLVTLDQDFYAFTSAADRTAAFTAVPAGSHTVTVTAFNVNGQSTETTTSVTVLNPGTDAAPAITPPASTPSVVTPPVVSPLAKAPSRPRHVAVATRTGGKAVVTFTAPRYLHHRAITGYIVKLAGQRKRVDADTFTVTFRGLTKGGHKVRVYARNKAGRSRANGEHVAMSRAKAAAKPITLKLGMLGWTVRQLQEELVPTKAHLGEFDTATHIAVLRWQRNHGKKLTGVVNARMRSALRI